MRKSVYVENGWVVCLLLLCGFLLPAVAQAKSLNQRNTSSVSPAARSAISVAIGRDQAAYHAQAIRNGYRLKHPETGLVAEFTGQGMQLKSADPGSWGLKLEAYGSGQKLWAVPAARPRANGNRVEYRRGYLVEWYANGPAGLEQGFTIAKPPAPGASGALILALALSGDLTAKLDAGKSSLSLCSRNGKPAMRYAGLTAYDATGRGLHSWLELRGRRLLVRVDATRAQYPLVVDPYFLLAKLTASDGRQEENFGLSISTNADGSVIAVGAPYATVGSNLAQGAVYVFVRPAGGWQSGVESARLTASDGAVYSLLGNSVGISGDGSTVVAGAPGATIGQNLQEGAAYVFLQGSGGWKSETETAKLTASDAGADSEEGWSVGISPDGHWVVVGKGGGSGGAYVFQVPSGGWQSGTETVELVASDQAPADFFGLSVSVSREDSSAVTVAVGAPYKTIFADVPEQGAAYVFLVSSSDSGTKTETAELTALNGAMNDLLGNSVSISANGSTVAAGTPGTGFETFQNEGGVYIFERGSNGWFTETESGFLGASDAAANANLGSSVSINSDGSQVVAGAPPGQSPGQINPQGATYVFVKPQSGWGSDPAESAKLAAPDTDPYAAFGYAVSVSGDGSSIVVGSPGSNAAQGAAYVFGGPVLVHLFQNFAIAAFAMAQGTTSTGYDLSSKFTPSTAIDPVNEPVRLQLGSLFLTIPSGSYHQNKQGNYVFEGMIDGISIDSQIKVSKGNTYQFLFQAPNAPLQTATGPITIVLSIGNDGGSTIY